MLYTLLQVLKLIRFGGLDLNESRLTSTFKLNVSSHSRFIVFSLRLVYVKISHFNSGLPVLITTTSATATSVSEILLNLTVSPSVLQISV